MTGWPGWAGWRTATVRTTFEDALRLGRALQRDGLRVAGGAGADPRPGQLRATGGGSWTSPSRAASPSRRSRAHRRPSTADAYDIIQPDASICGGVGAAAGHRGHGARRGASAVCRTPAMAPSPSPPRSRCCRCCRSIARSRAGCRRCWSTTSARTRCVPDLPAQPLVVRDGWMDIPDGPGLGIEVDEAAVSRSADPLALSDRAPVSRAPVRLSRRARPGPGRARLDHHRGRRQAIEVDQRVAIHQQQVRAAGRP